MPPALQQKFRSRQNLVASILVRWWMVMGMVLVCSQPARSAPFNVRDFGAKGDGTNNDSAAIQAAVDACSRAGGGEVIFLAGDYFTGKIVLKSHVTLRLEAGAVVRASGRAEDYEHSPAPEGNWFLIVAEGQKDIAIVGQGEIRGVGEGELDRRTEPDGGPLPPRRFGIIRFDRCKNVHLRDVRIRSSDWHTAVFFRCEKVFVDGVSILNNFYHTNSDGLDPVSCRDVFISNCYIVAGDDCICPKTEEGLPLENLVVNNCILESVSAAIKLGTGSSGDFRDIKVSNCVIRNSGVGIGFFIIDGGTVERASFSNLSIETTGQEVPINSRLRNNIIPIYVDIGKRTESSPVGKVRDVTFSDIQIASDSGVLIQGMPESPIENLTLRNITFRVSQGFDYSRRTKRAGGKVSYQDGQATRFIRQPTYLALARLNGFALDGIRVLIDDAAFKQFSRSAVAVFESKNGVIENVQRQPPGTVGGQPVMTLDNCEQVLVTDCVAPPGTPNFLGLSGPRTKNIRLAGNDLGHSLKPVVWGKEVHSTEINASGF